MGNGNWYSETVLKKWVKGREKQGRHKYKTWQKTVNWKCGETIAKD